MLTQYPNMHFTQEKQWKVTEISFFPYELWSNSWILFCRSHYGLLQDVCMFGYDKGLIDVIIRIHVCWSNRISPNSYNVLKPFTIIDDNNNSINLIFLKKIHIKNITPYTIKHIKKQLSLISSDSTSNASLQVPKYNSPQIPPFYFFFFFDRSKKKKFWILLAWVKPLHVHDFKDSCLLQSVSEAKFLLFC